MTGEEMERAIAFVLQQQARFEGQMAELTAQHGELARQQKELAQQQKTTAAQVSEVTTAVMGTMSFVQKIAAAQIESEKRLRTMSERLDAFIVVVEKYITRNGNGQKPDRPQS